MNNQKGLISTIILITSLILIVVIVGGAIYLDSTNSWDKIGLNVEIPTDDMNNAAEELAPEEQAGQEVKFVPYQSPDQLYQLQLPDFWTGEERAGVSIFYSYDPADGQPEQRAKIEIGRVPNPDMLTASEWLTEQEIDQTTAQQAIFGDISGVMILQDNTDAKPGDVKSVIYMPVNDEVLVVTAESYGGTRDVAVQFFNAILNSWQWMTEVQSPEQLVTDEETLADEELAQEDEGEPTEEPTGESLPADEILE